MATDSGYWYSIYKLNCSATLLFQLDVAEAQKVKEGVMHMDNLKCLFSLGELHRHYLNRIKEFYESMLDEKQIVHLHARVKRIPYLIDSIF